MPGEDPEVWKKRLCILRHMAGPGLEWDKYASWGDPAVTALSGCLLTRCTPATLTPCCHCTWPGLLLKGGALQ